MLKIREMLFKKILDYLFFDLSNFNINIIKIYLNYIKNKFLMLRAPDFASEMLSWERYYHYAKKEERNIFSRSDSTKESLISVIMKLEKEFDFLNCIEVGSGPVSQFFTKFFINRKNIKIVTVDPLAIFYRKLHDQYFLNYNIECLTGFGENLTKIFEKDSFHLVYTQNAIDHSQNPILFIRNLVKILKPRGFLVMYGIFNEGSNQNWMGLHKWNINLISGNLLLTDKKRVYNNYNLTKKLPIKLVLEKIIRERSNNTDDLRYIVIYKKLNQKD